VNVKLIIVGVNVIPRIIQNEGSIGCVDASPIGILSCEGVVASEDIISIEYHE
jgi:hypothetical protein